MGNSFKFSKMSFSPSSLPSRENKNFFFLFSVACFRRWMACLWWSMFRSERNCFPENVQMTAIWQHVQFRTGNLDKLLYCQRVTQIIETQPAALLTAPFYLFCYFFLVIALFLSAHKSVIVIPLKDNIPYLYISACLLSVTCLLLSTKPLST